MTAPDILKVSDGHQAHFTQAQDAENYLLFLNREWAASPGRLSPTGI
jgi:hypothetical protein